MLESAEGEKIGESKIAARQGISMVVLSRVGMATPGMVSALQGASWPFFVILSQVMIPIIMNKLEIQGFFKKYPKSPAPLQVTVVIQSTSFFIFLFVDRSPWPCVDFCHTHVLCHLRAESLHQANGSWTAPSGEDQEHEEPSRVALLQQGLVDLEQSELVADLWCLWALTCLASELLLHTWAWQDFIGELKHSTSLQYIKTSGKLKGMQSSSGGMCQCHISRRTCQVLTYIMQNGLNNSGTSMVIVFLFCWISNLSSLHKSLPRWYVLVQTLQARPCFRR